VRFSKYPIPDKSLIFLLEQFIPAVIALASTISKSFPFMIDGKFALRYAAKLASGIVKVPDGDCP